GMPHALIGVFKASNYEYSVNRTPIGHLYDFTFNGNSWNAIHVAQTSYTFYIHSVGVIYNRPQASRSDNGSKIVYTWVESDLPSTTDNAPNLKAVTYDVPSGRISCTINYALKCS